MAGIRDNYVDKLNRNPIIAITNPNRDIDKFVLIGRGKQMKKYKLESLIYYTKFFADKEHIVNSSSKDIQEKLDQYSADGWRLVSTDATDFGMAVYIYLYFEKDA